MLNDLVFVGLAGSKYVGNSPIYADAPFFWTGLAIVVVCLVGFFWTLFK